jgi:hypothetical protein
VKRAGVLLFCACASSTAAPPPTPEAPVASATPSAAPAPAPVDTAKKRTRTGLPNPGARDGTKPKNGRPLNPHDPSGRTVFVRADDHCFVEVASSDPDARATEVVDCPTEANDPAYDHCTAQIVLEPGTSKCYCVTGRGNPRPMPNPTPCPANAK